MKHISLFFVSLLLSLNTQAEIKSRALLDGFFVGCVNEDEAAFTMGESYEYCGCMTNTLAKELDTEELLVLSLELIRESGGMTEDEAKNLALQKILENDTITEGIIACLVKLYD